MSALRVDSRPPANLIIVTISDDLDVEAHGPRHQPLLFAVQRAGAKDTSAGLRRFMPGAAATTPRDPRRPTRFGGWESARALAYDDAGGVHIDGQCCGVDNTRATVDPLCAQRRRLATAIPARRLQTFMHLAI